MTGLENQPVPVSVKYIHVNKIKSGKKLLLLEGRRKKKMRQAPPK